MTLDDIRDAIVGADREAVEALLNAEDSDLNAFSVDALLGIHVRARRGAVPEQVSGITYSASWCVEKALARRPYLLQDRHFIEARSLVIGITEDGSYKKWLRRPHRSVLRLRSLVSRGRATLRRRRSRRRARGSDAQAEHAITFLIKLGDNGVVWNILSFWKETN